MVVVHNRDQPGFSGTLIVHSRSQYKQERLHQTKTELLLLSYAPSTMYTWLPASRVAWLPFH